MSTRFNYAISTLDKAQFQGRVVPALVVQIEEMPRKVKDQFIPGILITYITPAGQEEQQLYEGAVDSIPAASNLGRLLQAFAAMGVDDIADSGFGNVRNKYLLLKVDSIRNSSNGVAASFHYRRLPLRWLSDDEALKAFGKHVPLDFLTKLVDELEARLDGVGHSNVLSRLITDAAFRDHAPDIDRAISDGTFLPWLESHTRLRVNTANTFTLEEKKDDTATGNTGKSS